VVCENPAADSVPCLEDGHAESSFQQCSGGGETSSPGTDDDDIDAT
jgi:hypothetical protein